MVRPYDVIPHGIVWSMRAELERWLALAALERIDATPTDWPAALVFAAIHIAGLTALWVLFQYPLLSAALLAAGSLCLLLAPQLLESLHKARPSIRMGVLAPLLAVYVVIGLRLALKYALGWTLPTYAGGEPLNLVAALITTENILLAALVYVALIYLAQTFGTEKHWPRAAAAGLLALTFAWAAWEYFGHRTAGVTGSDPYAYVQMAVDWVQRGSPLHAFPMFAKVVASDLPYFAAVHVGYHLPLQNLVDAPSVWPTGESAFLGLAYRALGESGAYVVAPVFGLLVLSVLGLSAARSTHPRAPLVAAVAVLLLATSFEQVNRLLIPMADVPAQFFSLLAIALAMAAPTFARGRPLRLSLLGVCTGAAFGLAYWIRHTQLLLGPALLLAVWLWPGATRRERITYVIALGAGALLTALPDMLYHQQVFGGIFNVESEELQYYRAEAIGAALSRVSAEFMLPHEFGFIWPLALIGAVQMARAQFRVFAVLVAWLLAVLAVHLPYAALRLRDLLGEFPVLVWWTAWGAASLLGQEAAVSKTIGRGDLPPKPAGPPAHRIGQASVQVVIISIVLLALSLRTQTTLARTLSVHGAGFGYMLPAERASFDELAHLTPGDAVVATTSSSGALDLYAIRQTVRPNVWSVEQFEKFLGVMRAEQRPVYLLYDSPDLRPLRDHLRETGRLAVVRQFSALTFFGDREPEAGTLYTVVP